jgi:hypothetical protein
MQEKALEMLKQRLKTEVIHFFLVSVLVDEAFEDMYIYMSQEALIIEKADDWTSQIRYEYIKLVYADKGSFFLIQIDLFDDYFKSSKHIYLATNNRKDFLHKFKTVFRTYNFIRHLKAINLPMFQRSCEEAIRKLIPKKYFKLPKFFFFNEDLWEERIYKEYSFLLPKNFRPDEMDPNLFYMSDPANRDNFYSVQISRNIPISAKQYMSSKANLEYYAIDLMTDWMEMKRNPFLVEESTIFQKRIKWNSDQAQWTGHFLKCRGIKDTDGSLNDHRYYVAVLRRAYIPPFLDVFDDIVLMAQFTNVIMKDPINKKQPKASKSVVSEKEQFDRLFLSVVDSVATIEDQYHPHKLILEDLITSLGNTSEDYLFMETYHGLVPPEAKDFSMHVINYIRVMIEEMGDEKESSPEYENVAKDIAEKMGGRSNYDELRIKSTSDFFTEVFNNMEGIALPKAKPSKKRNWEIKVIDYLVYALNEGLYPSKFSIATFFTVGKCLSPDPPSQTLNLKAILVLLLRFVKKNDDGSIITALASDGFSIVQIIQKFIGPSDRNYSYNVEMLGILLKMNFFYNEFSKDMQTYVKFLTYFLDSESTDIHIKINIVHSIINIFDSKTGGRPKEFLDAVEKNTNLLISIIQQVKALKNIDFIYFSLGVLRTIALEKDSVQSFLMKEGDIIEVLRGVLDAPLKSHTLKLAAFSLMFVMTKNNLNKDAVSNNLKKEILDECMRMCLRIDIKNGQVMQKLLEITQKLIRQHSFRDYFNDLKLLPELCSMNVYLGYQSEKIKLYIYGLFVNYHEINVNQAAAIPPDTVDFIYDSFTNLLESEMNTNDPKLLKFCLYSLNCLHKAELTKKRFKSDPKVEAIFKLIKEVCTEREVKISAAKIHNEIC